MTSTKDRILDAALTEFGAQGYFRTTMDRLAEKSGVAKGTLYWHFKSKEGLLFAAMDRQYAKLGERVARMLNLESPSPDVLTTMLDFRRWLDKDLQRFSRLMLSLWTDVSSDLRNKVEKRMRTGIRQFTDMTERLLDSMSDGPCIPGISNRVLATVIIATGRGVFLQWSMDPDGTDVEGVSRALQELIVHRIKDAHK